MERLEAEKKWAAQYMDLVATHAKAPPPSPAAATEQLNWYRTTVEAVEANLVAVRRELKRTEDALKAARRELAESGVDAASRPRNLVEISVLVHATKAAKGALMVTYLATGAEWTASYDVRVGSRDGSLQLAYSASVVNRTEEDWHDARLSLSTAAPAVGGEPPPLRTLRARIAPPMRHFAAPSPASSSMFNPMALNVMLENRLELNEMAEDSRGAAAASGGEGSTAARVLTATTERSDVCALFEVPRPATLLSDGKPHKLAITVATLQATLSCTAIPALLAKAFLRAKCKNTSGMPLLPGEASVFVDSNFVCKSQIKQTNANEELSVFLGVDPSVIVDFKPSRDTSGEVGLLRRTRTREVVHRMSIKNTKSVPVDVWVFDQLPLSEDDKVKVRPLEPDLSAGATDQVLLNEFNNVRWSLQLAPGQEQTVVLRYQLEYPKGSELQLV